MAAATTLGKLMVSYTVQLYQPVSQSEVGSFNSYASNTSVSAQPFQATLVEGMEESIKIDTQSRVQAIRPGIYTVDVTGVGTTGTPSTFSISAMNSAISTLVNSVGTLNSAYRYLWTVSLAQALQGAYFTATASAGTITAYADILKAGNNN